jgi:peptidoglycan/xylan/chitin deacetylase (PgdA/CDA1 family)
VGWLRKGSPTREAAKRLVAASARVLGTVTHVATREPMVALTFDDGPHPEATPRLLDLLAAHQARSTFFVVGLAARARPDIVRRMVDEGHAVGNHGWDHSSLPLLTRRGRRLQLEWCQETIPEQPWRLFRPPWGHQNLGTRWLAHRLGFEVVAWNTMAEDWRGEPADLLLARVEERLAPGAIVLFHDALFRTDDRAHRDRGPTLAAVEALLHRHADRYRFVTVPELLTRGRPRRWHWYKRSNPDWIHRQIGDAP